MHVFFEKTIASMLNTRLYKKYVFSLQISYSFCTCGFGTMSAN